MVETFHLRRKKSSTFDDEPPLEFFLPKSKNFQALSSKTNFKAIEAAPGANCLDVLIFAASVCLWITSSIMGGSHIAGAVMYTSSYKSMISRPVFVAFFIVQALSVIIEVATAVCVMICINYETEYHDVVLVAKMAIGLLLVSFVVLISVIILSLYAHAHHGLAHRFAADSCRNECAKGTDVIAHLFVGCTYEAIAINSCALPVVIYVLKKAVLFVKSEQQERKERYRAAKSRQPQSKRHQGPGHSQGGSTISLVDAVIPEIKLFRKLPSKRPIQLEGHGSKASEAVIRVLSEHQDIGDQKLESDSAIETIQPVLRKSKSTSSSPRSVAIREESQSPSTSADVRNARD